MPRAKAKYAAGGFAAGLTSGIRTGAALRQMISEGGSDRKSGAVNEPTAAASKKVAKKEESTRAVRGTPDEMDGAYRKGGRVMSKKRK